MAANSVIGMVRDNNEDNMQVSADLCVSPMSHVDNQLYELGTKGALMVVADGMGGMNAGEVASQIAIDTVKNCYAPENITDEVVKTRYTIERFMNSVITEADNRIKQTAKDNPATKGMGTTMVQAWIFDRYVYVSWAGDSRAYVFNPSNGLKRLSKDHSLVQELVDSGKISKEDAFDYPDSNVITNCLSAVSQKAVPDALKIPHQLEKGDIILLCSDGLCGLIRDAEIQSVIANNQDDMELCCESLIKAACDAGGHDNITVALCKIVSVKDSDEEPIEENHGRKTWIKWGGVALLAILIGLAVWHFWPTSNGEHDVIANEKDTSGNNQVAPTSTNPTNDANLGEDKVWKFIFKNFTTDVVKAEFIRNPNTQQIDFRMVATDENNGSIKEYLFKTFTSETIKDGKIIHNYINETQDNDKGTTYQIQFDVMNYKNGFLDGLMINKDNDTVYLKDIPLENSELMPIKGESQPNSGTGSSSIDNKKGEGSKSDKLDDLMKNKLQIGNGINSNPDNLPDTGLTPLNNSNSAPKEGEQ